MEMGYRITTALHQTHSFLKYRMMKITRSAPMIGKIRSTMSCVQKFVSTSVPSKVYEMPYASRRVTNRSGGRLKIDDIVKYAASE